MRTCQVWFGSLWPNLVPHCEALAEKTEYLNIWGCPDESITSLATKMRKDLATFDYTNFSSYLEHGSQLYEDIFNLTEEDFTDSVEYLYFSCKKLYLENFTNYSHAKILVKLEDEFDFEYIRQPAPVYLQTCLISFGLVTLLMLFLIYLGIQFLKYNTKKCQPKTDQNRMEISTQTTYSEEKFINQASDQSTNTIKKSFADKKTSPMVPLRIKKISSSKLSYETRSLLKTPEKAKKKLGYLPASPTKEKDEKIKIGCQGEGFMASPVKAALLTNIISPPYSPVPEEVPLPKYSPRHKVGTPKDRITRRPGRMTRSASRGIKVVVP